MALFLVLLMSLWAALGVGLMIHDLSLAGDYLGPLDSLIAISSTTFLPVINWSLNQDTKYHNSQTRQKLLDDSNDQILILFDRIDQIVRMRLSHVSGLNTEDGRVTHEIISQLSQDMTQIKNRYDAIQKAKGWLADRDFLWEIAQRAGDFVLNQNSLNLSTVVSGLLAKTGILLPERKKVYQEIYDCLFWIKDSFYFGDYKTSERLLSRRVQHRQFALQALQWIQQEYVDRTLDEDSREELLIYFCELMQRLRGIGANV